MSTFDWSFGVTVSLALGWAFFRGLLQHHRHHRANRDRERRALKASAERGQRGRGQ